MTLLSVQSLYVRLDIHFCDVHALSECCEVSVYPSFRLPHLQTTSRGGGKQCIAEDSQTSACFAGDGACVTSVDCEGSWSPCQSYCAHLGRHPWHLWHNPPSDI